ncbi:MAG: heme-binding protein [Archangium sp.]|nr:heme-binding protein [Archangium sp.]
MRTTTWLAGSIFGGNRGAKKIAMTAPVALTPAGQKIAMTAPVTQTAGAENTWVVRFTMPASFTPETLPEPTAARVTVKTVPARRVAVLRSSGGWSGSRFEAELATLQAALMEAGLTARGSPTWARYDPPWVPWFMRTNEVSLELEPPAPAPPLDVVGQ